MLTALACAGGLAAVFTTMLTLRLKALPSNDFQGSSQVFPIFFEGFLRFFKSFSWVLSVFSRVSIVLSLVFSFSGEEGGHVPLSSHLRLSPHSLSSTHGFMNLFEVHYLEC